MKKPLIPKYKESYENFMNLILLECTLSAGNNSFWVDKSKTWMEQSWQAIAYLDESGEITIKSHW